MSYAYPDACLLVFAKAPVPGSAKTRLIPVIGAEQAACLQSQMTANLISHMYLAELCPVQLWCSPDISDPSFSRLEQQFGISLHSQAGNDLGLKMYHALNCALSRGRIAIVVGSDCPQIQDSHIHEMICALEMGNRAVIIPAVDGGYVALATSQADRYLFEGITWGSDSVLNQTRAKLKELNWKFTELAPQRDIDTPEDLQYLINNTDEFNLDKPLQRYLLSLKMDSN